MNNRLDETKLDQFIQSCWYEKRGYDLKTAITNLIEKETYKRPTGFFTQPNKDQEKYFEIKDDLLEFLSEDQVTLDGCYSYLRHIRYGTLQEAEIPKTEQLILLSKKLDFIIARIIEEEPSLEIERLAFEKELEELRNAAPKLG